jgi:hypothetical protein
MGTDTTVTNDQYSGYFKEGTAAEGVAAIIAAGKFIINESPVPATEEELEAKYPEGYIVNDVVWLKNEEGCWTAATRACGATTGGGGGGGQQTPAACLTYDAAVLAGATGLAQGLEARLYDTDGDKHADLIETYHIEGVLVDKITDNGNGTYHVTRWDPPPLYSPVGSGGFDGSSFSAASGGDEREIKKENLHVEEGMVGMFWRGPDGWVIDKPIEVNGILVESIDHEVYFIDGVRYDDAIGQIRNNTIISSRGGQFSSAHDYFGFINNAEGLKISLWVAPTADYPETKGAPMGFTCNENAKEFLARAIAFAAGRRASVQYLSADGSDVPSGATWTTWEAYNELTREIEIAQTVLASDAIPAHLDYQVFQLFMVLHSSAGVMGAQSYRDYKGFDNQVFVKE